MSQPPFADDAPQAMNAAGSSPTNLPTNRASGTEASAFNGSSGGSGDGRQTYAADELAIVLSHYDLGTIESIQEFPRGSRKAPKLILRTAKGLYLLKRRARGKDDPLKVAFDHALQKHLAKRKFPLPRLIDTRKKNNSVLRLNEGTYELFEYIKGASHDWSSEATQDAGKILAQFHKLLKDYSPGHDSGAQVSIRFLPSGSYHQSRAVGKSLRNIPEVLMKLYTSGSDDRANKVNQLVQNLQAAYDEAAGRANELGLNESPEQIVHSDWHPGNMLFLGTRVVAVVDYDAARYERRITDAANGALQFSILGRGYDPATWPEQIDESRYKGFLQSYDLETYNGLSSGELRCVPWLMIEALIAESVIPIAKEGSFARMEAVGFLQMVWRKARWLRDHADHLVHMIEG